MAGRLEGKGGAHHRGRPGQGAAEARLFAEHGAKVAVTDIAGTGDVAWRSGITPWLCPST